MKKSIGLLAFCLVAFAPVAAATEYPLYFKPNPGARALVVAGYKFDANNNVVGTCSYYTVSSTSGKGGSSHAAITTYNQTCTWDLKGALLGMSKGAPALPVPISIQGGHVIFAVNANGDTTGYDLTPLPGHGFVSTPGSHYTWLSPMTTTVLQDVVYTLTETLKSDGDLPVDITAVTVTDLLGVATLKSSTCSGEIAVGATCSIAVTYDPTKLKSPTGLEHDIFRIDLTSDAGLAEDFVQILTIVLPNYVH